MTMQTLNRLVTRDRIVRVDRVFRRFDLGHRLEHGALIVCVVALLLTGLPQKYSNLPFSATLIGWLGGIETARLVHRIAAIGLVLVASAHALGTLHRLLVLRLPPHMLLLTRDLRDLLRGALYRLGRAKEPPDMGRFTYDEKLLYWAVVWSVAVLIASGLMMLKPVTITRFLPGQIIPAARWAHGSEALLVLMLGVGWHVWHVAFKQRNWSMFSGLMTETDMLRQHPLEWDAIMDGRDRLPLDVAATRRRGWRFALIAGPCTLAALGGLAVFLASGRTTVVTHPERLSPEGQEAAAGSVTLYTTPAPPTDYRRPTWSHDVQPLLADRCGACHNQDEALDLTNYDGLLSDEGTRPLVVPGNPAHSALVLAQAGGDHPGQLSGDDLATVIVWIENGAPR